MSQVSSLLTESKAILNVLADSKAPLSELPSSLVEGVGSRLMIKQNLKERLQELQKLILEARVSNANLYNDFMTLKSINYILSSGSAKKTPSVEDYLDSMSYARCNIDKNDSLRDHQIFGAHFTQRVNPGMIYPPNFFVFDFDSIINFSLTR